MTPSGTSISTPLFLSWKHTDENLKDALLAKLLPSLGLFTDLTIDWWEDSHLLCGEQLTASILQRRNESEYSVLLLSTEYFGSAFICTHELPWFAGPTADRGALPAALRPLPDFGPHRTLHGIEKQLIYTYRGKSFAECRGHERDRFANEFAERIRSRILGLGGFRSL